MSAACKTAAKARGLIGRFVPDSGDHDYLVSSAKPVVLRESSVRSVHRFLSTAAPGLRIVRAARCVGYLCLIADEGGMWNRGFVVRPIEPGVRACTRDMQDVCAALGMSQNLDYVDLVTVDAGGGVAVYHNVYRAA